MTVLELTLAGLLFLTNYCWYVFYTSYRNAIIEHFNQSQTQKEGSPMTRQSKVREILEALIGKEVAPPRKHRVYSDTLSGLRLEELQVINNVAKQAGRYQKAKEQLEALPDAEQALYDAMLGVIKPKNAIDRFTRLNALFGKKGE